MDYKNYNFRGQPNLYWLCRLGKISEQLWTIFVVQKRLKILGCKTGSSQEIRPKRFETDTKSYKERFKFEPNKVIEKSGALCDKKLRQSAEYLPYNNTNIVHKLGWTTQTCSQGGWRCRSHKQKNMSDSTGSRTRWTNDSSYAQVRLFARKKEEDKFQQFVHVSYLLDEFMYLLDVMISVFDKVIVKRSTCNVQNNTGNCLSLFSSNLFRIRMS